MKNQNNLLKTLWHGSTLDKLIVITTLLACFVIMMLFVFLFYVILVV